MHSTRERRYLAKQDSTSRCPTHPKTHICMRPYDILTATEAMGTHCALPSATTQPAISTYQAILYAKEIPSAYKALTSIIQTALAQFNSHSTIAVELYIKQHIAIASSMQAKFHSMPIKYTLSISQQISINHLQKGISQCYQGIHFKGKACSANLQYYLTHHALTAMQYICHHRFKTVSIYKPSFRL